MSQMKSRPRRRFAIIVSGSVALALIIVALGGFTIRNARLIAPSLRENGWIAPDASNLAAAPWVWDKDGAPEYPRHPFRFTPREERLIDEAAARIPELRMGEARLTLLDDTGAPLPAGARATFALLRHQFLFGMDDLALPHIDRVRRLLRVNTVWVASPWRELQRGNPRTHDFRFPEHGYAREWRAAAGYTTVLHPVIWLIQTKFDGAQMHSRIPEFFYFDVRPSQQKDVLLDHVRAMAEYSRGRYDIVNLLNEPVNDWANPMAWDWREEMLPFFAEVFREFRRINPDSQLMVNVAGPFMDIGEVTALELVQWLSDNGARPDWVGIEIWANGTFPWNRAMGYMSIEQLAAGLAMYQPFGIPIYITEFATPMAGEPYFKWKWNPERQERYVRAVMTLAYGTPGVGGINYFQTYDTFMAESGLLDEESQPRPILGVLESIMNEWTTTGEAAADAAGTVAIRGHGGFYEVTATDPSTGREYYYTCEIKAQSRGELTLTPEPPPAPVAPQYAELGPIVRAAHVMEATLEPISPDDLGPHDDGGQFTHLNEMSIFYELARPESTTFVLTRPSGFIPVNVPEGGGTFRCDLVIETDNGILEALQVISGTRRWFIENVANGAYHFAFDVQPGEKPCVYAMWSSRTAKITIHSPRFMINKE